MVNFVYGYLYHQGTRSTKNWYVFMEFLWLKMTPYCVYFVLFACKEWNLVWNASAMFFTKLILSWNVFHVKLDIIPMCMELILAKSVKCVWNIRKFVDEKLILSVKLIQQRVYFRDSLPESKIEKFMSETYYSKDIKSNWVGNNFTCFICYLYFAYYCYYYNKKKM